MLSHQTLPSLFAICLHHLPVCNIALCSSPLKRRFFLKYIFFFFFLLLNLRCSPAHHCCCSNMLWYVSHPLCPSRTHFPLGSTSNANTGEKINFQPSHVARDTLYCYSAHQHTPTPTTMTCTLMSYSFITEAHKLACHGLKLNYTRVMRWTNVCVYVCVQTSAVYMCVCVCAAVIMSM